MLLVKRFCYLVAANKAETIWSCRELFFSSPLQIARNVRQAPSGAGRQLVLQIASHAAVSGPTRPDCFAFATKARDYFDVQATWLTVISDQNRNPVSLVKDAVC